MGQVCHSIAMTAHTIRAAIQRSQVSATALSREFGINLETVAKWRKRETAEDRKPGPEDPRSTVLSEAGEAMVVAFRWHTLLPLDDCLHALQPSIPHLTRSALQALPHWLLSHGYRRSADRRGQALSSRCHRPDQQVCGRPTDRESRQTDGLGVPGACTRSRSLLDPHDFNR